MKRREPKLPKGPKPARVNAEAAEIQLAERIARMVLARLRAEAPQLFGPPSSVPPVETPRA